MWDKLKAVDERTNPSTIMQLKNKLQDLFMETGDSMETHMICLKSLNYS